MKCKQANRVDDFNTNMNIKIDFILQLSLISNNIHERYVFNLHKSRSVTIDNISTIQIIQFNPYLLLITNNIDYLLKINDVIIHIDYFNQSKVITLNLYALMHIWNALLSISNINHLIILCILYSVKCILCASFIYLILMNNSSHIY